MRHDVAFCILATDEVAPRERRLGYTHAARSLTMTTRSNAQTRLLPLRTLVPMLSIALSLWLGSERRASSSATAAIPSDAGIGDAKPDASRDASRDAPAEAFPRRDAFPQPMPQPIPLVTSSTEHRRDRPHSNSDQRGAAANAAWIIPTCE